jgi:hypothetical protein
MWSLPLVDGWAENRGWAELVSLLTDWQTIGDEYIARYMESSRCIECREQRR